MSRRPRGTAGTRRLLVYIWVLLNSVRGLEITKDGFPETSTLGTSSREAVPQQRTHIPTTDPSDHLFLLPDSTTLAVTATAIDHRIQQQQQLEIRISLQAMADIVVLHLVMGAAAHRPIEMGTDMTIDMTTIESLVALSHPLVMRTAETAGTMPTALEEEEDFLLLVTTLLMRAVATIIIVR